MILFVVQRCNVTALTSSPIIYHHKIGSSLVLFSSRDTSVSGQCPWSVSLPPESEACLHCVVCFQGNRYEQEKLLKQSHTLYVGNLSFYTTEEQVGSFSSFWRPNNSYYILIFFFFLFFLLVFPSSHGLWFLLNVPEVPFDSSNHTILTFVFLFLSLLNRSTSCFLKVEMSSASSSDWIKSRRQPADSAS